MINMTRRVGLALALAVLGPAQAKAVFITGYAQGTITTTNRTQPAVFGAPLYEFTPGEALYLSFRFDPATSTPFDPSGPNRQSYFFRPAFFELTTGGGYKASGESSQLFEASYATAGVTNGPTDSLRLFIGSPAGYIELSFSDPTGTALSSTALPTQEEISRFPGATLHFDAERRGGNEDFDAIIVPVADASDFPVPEPSTFALGGIGLMILGLGYARGRRERSTARRPRA